MRVLKEGKEIRRHNSTSHLTLPHTHFPSSTSNQSKESGLSFGVQISLIWKQLIASLDCIAWHLPALHIYSVHWIRAMLCPMSLTGLLLSPTSQTTILSILTLHYITPQRYMVKCLVRGQLAFLHCHSRCYHINSPYLAIRANGSDHSGRTRLNWIKALYFDAQLNIPILHIRLNKI